MPSWAAIALMLFADLIPVAVVARRIGAHARRAGVPARRHYKFAFFGGLWSGLLTQCLILVWLTGQLNGPQPDVSFALGFSALMAAGLLSSAVVSGAVYLHLRMRTARDPDYEEPTDPGEVTRS